MAERLFGTNGIRGVVNEAMSPALALDVGRAVGTYTGGTVAIGVDSRTSADMVRSAVAAGVMSSGTDVLDLGLLPTPALQYFVKTSGINGGLMITASHNPPEFNGIKAVDADGTEMHRSKEEEIEEVFYARRFRQADWRRVGQSRRAEGAVERYLAAVAAGVDRQAIREAGLKVVLDCANGAASVSTPRLLEDLGVTAVTLNCNPLGTFPGHPSEPTEDHLAALKAMVLETGAALGIAHDGDGDRTIFVDHQGRYVYGDRSLAVVAARMVRESGGGKVVTPVSTSLCVQEAVQAAGGEVVYTRVGAPVVARAMREIGAVFGGEENGGLIFPRHQYCRDGAMTAAKMIEIVAQDGPLSELLGHISSYQLDKRKMHCPEALKEGVLRAACRAFPGKRLDLTDGVKVFYESGWVLIRPSGTEPIFRIYSEARSREEAAAIADECESILNQIVSQMQE